MNYLKFLALILSLGIFGFSEAQVNHSVWNNMLQAHVTSSGNVNYAGFKRNALTLENYLFTLRQNPPQASWSKNAQLAYWINAYNAYTIKLIVDNYPVSSIMELHDGKPWDVKWIEIGNKTYSLNNIEHDIIRAKFDEPRIHFAVNCAAKSCPPILNRAWTAKNLEANLEAQTRTFINDSRYNQISAGGAKLSKIFEWYAKDFGDLATYVNKYASRKVKAGRIDFLEYDWALNE